MKPCTLGKRHKWAFVNNVITQRLTGCTVHLSKRGVYRCECGQRKDGAAQ
jgi:hypothetical protein